ncbi:DUF4232 domain-containing protein [Amycolatopsis thermoflava]
MPAHCSSGDLQGRLDPQPPAAGNRYATLRLTNTSGQVCTLEGYGRLRLVGPRGEDLPTEMHREPGAPPRTVSLQPGETARQDLHWGVVPTGDEPETGLCEPEPEELRVTPPAASSPVPVPWRFGPVCAHGAITVSPYQSA